MYMLMTKNISRIYATGKSFAYVSPVMEIVIFPWPECYQLPYTSRNFIEAISPEIIS